MVRIYLIDDHPVVLHGFSRTFADEPDFLVVGQATTAKDGLAGARALAPDVVLVDPALPDLHGVELIAALKVRVPRAKLLVVSAHDDECRVIEAMGAGAAGYLLKASSVPDLIRGVRLAARGGRPLTPRLAIGLALASKRPGDVRSGGVATLTARELQVLRLFARGSPIREIARDLCVSLKTVETHRTRLYEKLGARTAVDLSRLAVRAGLIRA